MIRDTPVDQIAAFHAARYVPSSVVIAAAGSVDHDEVVALAERTLGGLRAGARAPRPDPAPADPAASLRFARKDTEQVHVCLGGVGIPRGDDRRFAVRVLDAIFGGLSSSRLFQAVREERGLAYSVYSFAGPVRRHRPGRPLRRHAAGQPRRGDGGRRRRARAPARGARPPRRSCTARARTSRRASCWRWSPRPRA